MNLFEEVDTGDAIDRGVQAAVSSAKKMASGARQIFRLLRIRSSLTVINEVEKSADSEFAQLDNSIIALLMCGEDWRFRG